VIAALSPAERRRLRDEFEARERARMKLPPRSTEKRPARQTRRVDAERRRLLDQGYSDEVAHDVAREHPEPRTAYEMLQRMLGASVPRRRRK
jgi:hypothetical protein